MIEATGIDFNPAFPWWVLMALVAAGGAILLVAATAHARGIWWRAMLLGGGCLALLNPTLVREQRDYQPDVVALVVDHTASQQTGDRFIGRADRRARSDHDQRHQ